MITRAVDEALHDHDGDITTATEALVKKAVPNAMALFEATRVGGNYEHTVYPETLEFLRKKTKDGADEIWEGRHNWTNTHLTEELHNGTHSPITVNALDTNASFLSAFKTHLPIGALIHDPTAASTPNAPASTASPPAPPGTTPTCPTRSATAAKTAPSSSTTPPSVSSSAVPASACARPRTSPNAGPPAPAKDSWKNSAAS
ncbi:hypothetical protein [Streptomyces sp. C8S0]|uniref:hypothetical protein n=1 Tax=Streptomyces sp. C8S0 TaxID=2585716 RepID=UPI001D047E35|nr:hypothetical protein [Streptomyces sp. C8S0]